MANKTFTQENYEKKSTFASFLPGLAGTKGIPIWCYYVNRGQAVASFGVEDKDHAIMEFFPAHQSYQLVDKQGFRTFVRKNGSYFELFSKEDTKKDMHISMNYLEIEEEDKQNQLHSKVEYFVLPGEAVGALVRKLEITNTGSEACYMELLDGMPVIIPYGVDMSSIKNMGQTAKAWLQVEELETKVPYFRVRASLADSACVKEVEGGNFSYCVSGEGTQLPVLVDPTLVFGYDVSLSNAVGFRDMGLQALLDQAQVVNNQYPCSFFGVEKELKAGESLKLYQLIGQVENKKLLHKFMEVKRGSAYFESKKEEAKELVEQLCTVIETKTASADFDAYTSYTYMDNVLRGGFPIQLPGNKVFHVYSRKHGDIERDYNYFKMQPEFYSQGNGNFRDVNQNRRCDPFFTPYVGSESIKRFYSLIQLDGYNPLAVEKTTYYLKKEKTDKIFCEMPSEKREKLAEYFEAKFSPGMFFKKMRELEVEDKEVESYFEKVMEAAESELNAELLEGYWTDHWTYNLDLVESYLSIFPEKEEEILFHEEIPYYVQQVSILPRKKRYQKTTNGIRQYQFLNEHVKSKNEGKFLKNNYGKGNLVVSSLMEKLILLCVTKFTALDSYGMGIEMEGGKPGWYDALNGMPGLFGSSMAETYELDRNFEYTLRMLEKYPQKISLLAEVADLLTKIYEITIKSKEDLQHGEEQLCFWNLRNDIKELYWEKTFGGISGEKKEFTSKELFEFLQPMKEVVDMGIKKAMTYEEGICPTYFTYEVTDYEEVAEGINPKQFKVKSVPLFLEGPVRYLKLQGSVSQKRQLYKEIKNSTLYDGPLKMYKVNESLEKASYEVGRAKAFTPGWLENESIWLHMEYKYLLELLKSGLYEEFMEDFKNAAVPFLDPTIYGRSIYENSSFIASSQNPNKAYHGKGFVARLSGSTVEFLNMWILMMFGDFFKKDEKELRLTFSPLFPSYLVGEEKRIEAMFLGNTKVIYHLAENRDYVPGQYEIERMEVLYRNGDTFYTERGYFEEKESKEIRDGKIEQIQVWMK